MEDPLHNSLFPKVVHCSVSLSLLKDVWIRPCPTPVLGSESEPPLGYDMMTDRKCEVILYYLYLYLYYVTQLINLAQHPSDVEWVPRATAAAFASRVSRVRLHLPVRIGWEFNPFRRCLAIKSHRHPRSFSTNFMKHEKLKGGVVTLAGSGENFDNLLEKQWKVKFPCSALRNPFIFMGG